MVVDVSLTIEKINKRVEDDREGMLSWNLDTLQGDGWSMVNQ